MTTLADAPERASVVTAAAPSPAKTNRTPPLLDGPILRRAVRGALLKLNPLHVWKNSVLFFTALAGSLALILLVRDILAGEHRIGFDLQLAIWLWLTVLFANFAESLAQAHGRARADSLRRARADAMAKRLAGKRLENVPASKLRTGDLVLAEAGDLIPADGMVIEGIAIIDESVITGESAPVIRESGGERSAVTCGTRVLSDWIKIRIISGVEETLLDKMIALVEGVDHQATSAETKIQRLISAFSLICLLLVTALYFASLPSTLPVVHLVALFASLLPVIVAGLLSTVGIAGIDRLMQSNVLATSPQALEAAANVHTLLLDKTGTITLGDRQAVEFLPFAGVSEEELARAAKLSSLADDTPEGRSVISLARQKYGLQEPPETAAHGNFIPFSAYTRMSGIDLEGRQIRKGASNAVAAFIREQGGAVPANLEQISAEISRTGGTPLVVSDGNRALGIIHLKDIIKGGIPDRMAQLRCMGVRPVMITGDNPVTAAAIAKEAGVDHFLAQATPADKLAFIKKEQCKGRLIAMTGDGTNDAPALAQADLGLTMNTGSSAAKDAGNMVDLDSDPAKLIEIIAIARQLMLTRWALLSFTLASTLAKSLLIVPLLYAPRDPALARLNLLHLHTAESALLSAVVFTTLAILAFIPLAIRGIRYRTLAPAPQLRRTLVLYGFGGLLVTVPVLWILDQILAFA